MKTYESMGFERLGEYAFEFLQWRLVEEGSKFNWFERGYLWKL
jgi:transcriptional regulator of nitric oxide reductase